MPWWHSDRTTPGSRNDKYREKRVEYLLDSGLSWARLTDHILLPFLLPLMFFFLSLFLKCWLGPGNGGMRLCWDYYTNFPTTTRATVVGEIAAATLEIISVLRDEREKVGENWKGGRIGVGDGERRKGEKYMKSVPEKPRRRTGCQGVCNRLVSKVSRCTRSSFLWVKFAISHSFSPPHCLSCGTACIVVDIPLKSETFPEAGASGCSIIMWRQVERGIIYLSEIFEKRTLLPQMTRVGLYFQPRRGVISCEIGRASDGKCGRG